MIHPPNELLDDRADPDTRAVLEDWELSQGWKPARLGLALWVAAAAAAKAEGLDAMTKKLVKKSTKKPAKKPRAKKPPVGLVYAIKKGKRAQAWMPDEVIVSLDGDPKGKLLIIVGWSLTTSARDKACTKWPVTRLETNLGRLERSWAEDFDKSWRLEIRAV